MCGAYQELQGAVSQEAMMRDIRNKPTQSMSFHSRGMDLSAHQ
jgi:hypothetical protein